MQRREDGYVLRALQRLVILFVFIKIFYWKKSS